MIWLFCLISFILGGLAFFLFSKQYIYKILKREKRLYRREMRKSVKHRYLKPFPIIEILKKHKDLYAGKVDKLDNSLRELSVKMEIAEHALKIHQDKVDSLTLENQRLLKISASSEEIQPSDMGDNHRGEVNKLVKVNAKTVSSPLFFSIPEADGSFYSEKGETDSDVRKFYRISSSGGNESAELHFISGQYDQKAIDNIDYYVIPVCEVENMALRNNASRIFQKEAGLVVKVSNKWVTEKKIKVKLL